MGVQGLVAKKEKSVHILFIALRKLVKSGTIEPDLRLPMGLLSLGSKNVALEHYWGAEYDESDLPSDFLPWGGSNIRRRRNCFQLNH